MAGQKAASEAWAAQLDAAITRVSRAARSARLHEIMAQRAKVELGEHLNITLAVIGVWQPVRASELAAHLDVERSTVGRRVVELMELGLVQRDADPLDGRAASLSLTRAGTRAINRVRAAWHQALLETGEGWSEEERVAAADHVMLLAEELDRIIDHGSEPKTPT
ncbi:MAG: putative transcriptional regulator, MarR family [Mycobacterium sp.]|nr:putative transcriptional regulator, MarR family [Mycobacterium sp.]